MTDKTSTSDTNNSPTRKWFVGPAQTNYFKFLFAGVIFWLVRTGPLARYVIKIPGATTAGIWAFEVRVMSRDFEEIEIEGLPDKYKTDNNDTSTETND